MALNYGEAIKVIQALRTIANYLGLTESQAASYLIFMDKDRKDKILEASDKFNAWIDLSFRERLDATADEMGATVIVEQPKPKRRGART